MKPPKLFLLGPILARPRLFISALAGIAAVLLLPLFFPSFPLTTRLIIGWNVGACLYLALVAQMVLRSSHSKIQQRAQLEDEGQGLILLLVVVAAVACLTTIVLQLGVVKGLTGASKYAHIGLALLTIVSSWAFTHLMFALHYAHEFYLARGRGEAGGLVFTGDSSGDNPPDYLDFVYFAFVIGTSTATADVALASKRMRRIVLLHCVLAFIFNTTVLALTINIAASLF